MDDHKVTFAGIVGTSTPDRLEIKAPATQQRRATDDILCRAPAPACRDLLMADTGHILPNGTEPAWQFNPGPAGTLRTGDYNGITRRYYLAGDDGSPRSGR